MTALGFCDVRVSYNGVEAVQSFNDLLHSGEWLCLIVQTGQASRRCCVRPQGSFHTRGLLPSIKLKSLQLLRVGVHNTLHMFPSRRSFLTT